MNESFKLIMDIATPIVVLLYIFASVFIIKQLSEDLRLLKSQVNDLEQNKVSITKNPRGNIKHNLGH